MRVAVHGELYARVSGEVLNELGMHTPTQKQRKARVPEVVPAYVGQSCAPEKRLEMPIDHVLSIERRTLDVDLTWIRDKSLEDSANLEDPDAIAEEIADDLQAALEQFATIATELKERE